MQRILRIPQIARDSTPIEETYEDHERITGATRRGRSAERHYRSVNANRQRIVDALIGTSAIRSINLVRL